MNKEEQQRIRENNNVNKNFMLQLFSKLFSFLLRKEFF